VFKPLTSHRAPNSQALKSALMPFRCPTLPESDSQAWPALDRRQPRSRAARPAGDRRLVRFGLDRQDLWPRQQGQWRSGLGRCHPAPATTAPATAALKRWRRRPGTTPPSKERQAPEQVVRHCRPVHDSLRVAGGLFRPQAATPCWPPSAASCANPSTTWRRIWLAQRWPARELSAAANLGTASSCI